MAEIVVAFTCKTSDDIIEIGGSGWWRVDHARVQAAGRVLLVQNTHDPRQPGNPELHGQAFLYATVRDMLQDEDGRWLIQIDEYAAVEGVFRWPGYRNPVAYMEENEVMGALDIGEWKKMPQVLFSKAQADRRIWDTAYGKRGSTGRSRGTGHVSVSPRGFGEVIETHRSQLAQELGVESGKVRIVIEA